MCLVIIRVYVQEVVRSIDKETQRGRAAQALNCPIQALTELMVLSGIAASLSKEVHAIRITYSTLVNNLV